MQPKFQPSTIFDFDDEEIARQLTLMDLALFQNIQPTEFFGQAWVKQKAPNIKAYIEHFDRTATAFESAILLQVRYNHSLFQRVSNTCQPTAVGRSFVFSRITRIAAYLRQMNTFNTMMALKCALTHNTIKRLKLTMNELPEPVKSVCLNDLHFLHNSQLSGVSGYGNVTWKREFICEVS